MDTPELVRPGGLMRCCMASLQQAREPATEAPLEGDKVQCKYCESWMIYRENAWQWDQPPLFMWTIYDHPIDHPDVFLARRFVLDRPTSEVILAKDIEELRERFRNRGLVAVSRSETDDPVIVETWL